MRTRIIAEAGVNHNGDLDMARRLISAAADAGADSVKFQTFQADRLVTRSAAKADYQIQGSRADESQHAMLRHLELDRAAHETLVSHCRGAGIRFLSTAFDASSLDMLAELGLGCFKIPSGEITNLPYLRHVGAYGREVILSTGMATLGEIEAALDILIRAGTSLDRIVVLHCNTQYPTPMVDVNLLAMITIRQAFGVTVGYSDHTLGVEVPIAAVALGAAVVEKHFTLDRDLPGPDQKVSLEPGELKAMVVAIRNVEAALGDGVKRPSASEARNRLSIRRSLVAARAIVTGELFSDANVAVKRPGTGLSPMHWDDVMGRKAPRDFAADDLIEL